MTITFSGSGSADRVQRENFMYVRAMSGRIRTVSLSVVGASGWLGGVRLDNDGDEAHHAVVLPIYNGSTTARERA